MGSQYSSWYALQQSLEYPPDESYTDRKARAKRAFNDYIKPYVFAELEEHGDNRYTHWGIYGPESKWARDGKLGELIVIGGETREYEARDIAIALANARRHERDLLLERVTSAIEDKTQ